MLPINDTIMPGDTAEIQPSDNYGMKIKKEMISGHVDGLDAMKQVIYKILGTERYDNIIYSWDYGLETRDLIGEQYDYVCAALKDRITEYLAAEKAQTELNKTLDEAIEKMAKINDFAPAKEAPAAE